MNFNLEQYSKYRRAAGKDEKDGFWDVTRFPNGQYCFATEEWLGDNGKINSHPLLNKRFERVKNGKVYLLDSACIHWQKGYYYHDTLKDENNSHTVQFIGNINCEYDMVIEGISEFNKNFKMIDNDK
jgi:hypothetical protein